MKINQIIKGKRWENISPEDYRNPISKEEYKIDSSAKAKRQEFISGWSGR